MVEERLFKGKIRLDTTANMIYIIHMMYERCDFMSDTQNTLSKRKRYNFTLVPEIQQEFKVACVKNQLDMNEVLEVLMQAYSDGLINLKELSE